MQSISWEMESFRSKEEVWSPGEIIKLFVLESKKGCDCSFAQQQPHARASILIVCRFRDEDYKLVLVRTLTQGIVKIKNLDEYVNLRTIYFACNAISKIEGLGHLVNLRCLYLNENLVEFITGLDTLQQLQTLDLADNQIRRVQGLSSCKQLRQLNLSGNRIQSAEDIAHLTECESLESLDLSKNRIDEEAALELIRTLNLRFLRMVGNPVVSTTRHYRKATIASMPELHYMDDSPVFVKDRRLAEAWIAGGAEAEQAMRETIRKEEADTRERHRREFDDLISKARAEEFARQQAKRERNAHQKLVLTKEKDHEIAEVREVVCGGDQVDPTKEENSQIPSTGESSQIPSNVQRMEEDVTLVKPVMLQTQESKKRVASEVDAEEFSLPRDFCKGTNFPRSNTGTDGRLPNTDFMDLDPLNTDFGLDLNQGKMKIGADDDLQEIMDLDPLNTDTVQDVSQGEIMIGSDGNLQRIMDLDPLNTDIVQDVNQREMKIGPDGNLHRIKTVKSLNEYSGLANLVGDAQELLEMAAMDTQDSLAEVIPCPENHFPLNSQHANSQGTSELEADNQSRPDVVETRREMVESANDSEGRSQWVERERTFKRELHERILRRAALDTELSSERDPHEEALGMHVRAVDDDIQAARPVIWGTEKYRNLWIKAAEASNSDDDIELEIQSNFSIEEKIYNVDGDEISESTNLIPEASVEI